MISPRDLCLHFDPPPRGGDDTQCRAMYLALLLVQGPVTGMTKMSSSLLILAIALPTVPKKRASRQVMTDIIQSRGDSVSICHRHT